MMHWGGRGAVLQCDKATYVNMTIILCTEEQCMLVGLRRFWSDLNLADDDPVTHNLY